MSAAQQIEPSEKARIRSLPIEFWPEADRKAWMSACRPSQRLKRGGAGSHLKLITLSDLERRYGYFLDFINRRGLLDPNKAAGGHVTPENVDTYLEELTVRVGSVTVQGSICKLRRACELVDPTCDMSWLADIEKDLALVMRPRSKADRWVLTEVLVEAGLTLIAEAENSRRMARLSDPSYGSVPWSDLRAMPQETPSRVKRRLSAIMAADLAGYTSLSNREFTIDHVRHGWRSEREQSAHLATKPDHRCITVAASSQADHHAHSVLIYIKS
jgi:hypothetical protein